jgi:hypothetical protein
VLDDDVIVAVTVAVDGDGDVADPARFLSSARAVCPPHSVVVSRLSR